MGYPTMQGKTAVSCRALPLHARGTVLCHMGWDWLAWSHFVPYGLGLVSLVTLCGLLLRPDLKKLLADGEFFGVSSYAG